MGTVAELSLQIWLGNGILALTNCTAARPSVATPTLQRMRALKVALRLSCIWESIQWEQLCHPLRLPGCCVATHWR